MTDPGAAPSSAAPRPGRAATQPPHAQAAKIFTAGLSTSMVLGLVAFLAHSTQQQEAADAAAARRRAVSEGLAAVLHGGVATSTPVTAPTLLTLPDQGATTASGATAAPVVIPVPVPAPAPATPAPRSTGGGGGSTPPPSATTAPSS